MSKASLLLTYKTQLYLYSHILRFFSLYINSMYMLDNMLSCMHKTFHEYSNIPKRLKHLAFGYSKSYIELFKAK